MKTAKTLELEDLRNLSAKEIRKQGFKQGFEQGFEQGKRIALIQMAKRLPDN